MFVCKDCNLFQITFYEREDESSVNQRETVMNKESQTDIEFTRIMDILKEEGRKRERGGRGRERDREKGRGGENTCTIILIASASNTDLNMFLSYL